MAIQIISHEIDAPVIDQVTAAVKFVEALVALGLGTSKIGDLAFAIAKPYTGTLQSFAYLPPNKPTYQK